MGALSGVGDVGAVMRHQKRRNPALGDGTKHQGPHPLAQTHIEFRKWLIQKQSLGLGQQRPRQRNAGTLSARKRCGVGIAKVLHFDINEGLHDVVMPLRFGAFGNGEKQVLLNRHVRK